MTSRPTNNSGGCSDWIPSNAQKAAPDTQPGGAIQAQCSNGCPTDRRQRNNSMAGQPEVVIPMIFARMKNWNQLTGLRIHGGKIWPLAAIALPTGKRKVLRRTWTARKNLDDFPPMW